MDPKTFRDNANKKSAEEILIIKEETAQKIKSAESSLSSKLAILERANKNTNITKGFAAAGFIASIATFVYLFFAFPHESDIQQFYASFGIVLTRTGDITGMGSLLLFGMPGIVFLIIFLAGLGINSSLIRRRTKEIDQLKKGTEERVAKYKSDLENKVQEIQDETEKQIDKQRQDYEKKRRSDSVKYANSNVAKEIIAMLLEGFKKNINASDRRPHIKDINVPFSFKVYKDRIETPYGLYDFEIERVSKLTDFEDQTSLANAVAQIVYTEIIAAYPEDISGGEVLPMAIDIEYGQEWVMASMTYRASNKNYVPERSF